MEDEGPHVPTEILFGGILVFSPLAFGATESWSRAVVAAIFLLLVLVRYRAFGWRGMRPAASPPLVWAMLGLLGLAALQAMNPASPLALALAKSPFTVSSRATWEWALDWSLYAGVLFFMSSAFRLPAASERLAWAILFVGAVLAAIGIAQQQAGNEFYYGLRRVSLFRMPFGPFPNKNHAGTYLAMSALIGAGLALGNFERYRKMRSEGKQDEFFGRLAVIASLEFLVLVGLIRARSRGAVAAAGVAGIIALSVYALHAGRRARWGAFAAVAGLGCLTSAGFLYAGMKPAAFFLALGETSVVFRRAMIGDGLQIISEFPFTGVGLGAIHAAYPLWIDSALKGFYTDHLHCDPVELAAEAGLPLAIAYYSAFVATLLAVFRGARRPEGSVDPISLAFGAAAICVLNHQLFEFPTHILSLQVTVFACLAAAWGRSVLSKTRGRPPLPPTPFKLTLLSSVFALFSAVVLLPRPIAAYFDMLSNLYPQPSRHYYQASALRWEATPERFRNLAFSNWQLAFDNPPARDLLLRKALRASSSALDLDPLNPDSRSLHDRLLKALNRGPDAGGWR